MEPQTLQRDRSGRAVTRALVVGVLLGLFGFVYFPQLWVGAVFLAVGAVLGLVATVLVSSTEDRRR